MIHRLLLKMLTATQDHKRGQTEKKLFDKILGYEGIKRFVRSLTSREPVHILLVGPPGQAKTLFLKCILETFRREKGIFYCRG
jgi:SpoVK/Ycf46/Vps4 family AAA+-type ATPase